MAICLLQNQYCKAKLILSIVCFSLLFFFSFLFFYSISISISHVLSNLKISASAWIELIFHSKSKRQMQILSMYIIFRGYLLMAPRFAATRYFDSDSWLGVIPNKQGRARITYYISFAKKKNYEIKFRTLGKLFSAIHVIFCLEFTINGNIE